jgi:hypothetical protein
MRYVTNMHDTNNNEQMSFTNPFLCTSKAASGGSLAMSPMGSACADNTQFAEGGVKSGFEVQL